MTGGVVVAALTVIVTVLVLISPVLSVTVSVKTYVPADKLVTVVVKLFGVVMAAPVGPLVIVHTVDAIVFGVDAVAVPDRLTVLVGSWTVAGLPAETVGGVVEGGVAVPVTNVVSPCRSIHCNTLVPVAALYT